VAYIKLTSKLRRMMEKLDRQMRGAGFKADLRWMEQNPGVCPLCGALGGRMVTISAVQVAEAGMVYVPCSLCEQCVARHYDPMRGDFAPESTEKIEGRIYAALGISPGDNYRNKVPEQFRGFLDAALKHAHEEGFAFNPFWLQNHTYTCPSCGKEETEPAKVGISATRSEAGMVVMIPYLVCVDCSRYTDEQLNVTVMDRLLEGIGRPVQRPKH
jgi:hypothetical protein